MVTALAAARLVGGFVLLLGNGFFVTTEFAMTRVRQFPEAEFTGHPGLERAWEMTERLEIFLSGCQVGITVCSVGLGVVAEPAATAVVDPLFRALGFAVGAEGHTAVSVIFALAVINLLHVVIGEQAPTYLGVERSKWVAKHGSRALYWWTKLLYPVISVADWLAKRLLSLFGVTISRSWAEEEMEEVEEGLEEAVEGPQETRGAVRARMGEQLSRMGLPDDRREEVIAALDIGSMETRDVMVDAESIVALSVAEPLAVNLERMRENPHSRFPLVGDSLEDLRGIVYTPAVLREQPALESGDATLSDAATPPMWVDASLSVSELIDRFQEEGQELALVGEDGAVVGLVTVTDAVEAITGEVTDPLDAEKHGDDSSG